MKYEIRKVFTDDENPTREIPDTDSPEEPIGVSSWPLDDLNETPGDEYCIGYGVYRNKLDGTPEQDWVSDHDTYREAYEEAVKLEIADAQVYTIGGFSEEDVKTYAEDQMEIDITDDEVKMVMLKLERIESTEGVNWDRIDYAISEIKG